MLFPNALERPGTWARRSELMSTAIERARPDVIGLQEVLPSTLDELPRLLGDFNALRSSLLIQALTSPCGTALVDATRTAAPQSGPPVTFHWGVGATRWGLSIDYVLAETALRATSCERIGERDGSLYASDHHLVVVEFSAQ